MIINSIICIQLFFWSTIKLVDLYLYQDKLSHQETIQFTKETRRLLKNEKGFGTLLGITLTFIFSLMIYFFVLRLDIEHRELINRKNTYLCYKKYSTDTLNYIKKINAINISISALNLASATGVLTPEAQAAQKALMFAQNAIHVLYLKNVNSIQYCSTLTKIGFVKNIPYQTNAFITFNRNLDSTTILRRNEWAIRIGNIPNKVRYSKLFAISSKYYVSSPYDISPKVIAEEVGGMALLR